LDEYGVIRIINFIRASVAADPAKFASNSAVSFPKDVSLWADDKFLIPVVKADPFIFIAESLLPGGVSSDDTPTPVAQVQHDEVAMLKSKIAQLQMLNASLAAAEAPAARRRRRAPKAQSTTDSPAPSGYESDDSSSGSSDGGSDLDREIDSGYFAAYGSFHIHEDMLKDRVRTEAYRDFMYKNKDLFKDKIVLDVGCGTGILSMFAAASGASKVFAVDASDIIEKAKLNIQENNLQHIISCFKGKAEQVVLPEKVDIIISEWMGYCLLFETMLPSVVFARERWLKPTGKVYPEWATMHIVALSDDDYIKDRINYWQDVYGFKMSAMQENVGREAHVDVMDPETVITAPCQVAEINCTTTSAEALDRVESKFELKIDLKGDKADKEVPLSMFVVYFDMEFDRAAHNLVGFSTGPLATPTHWKQTVVILKDKTLKVAHGDVIRGNISFSTSRDAFRDLDVRVSYEIVGKTGVIEQINFVST
jgi:type I protein arginine methyltransferase